MKINQLTRNTALLTITLITLQSVLIAQDGIGIGTQDVEADAILEIDVAANNKGLLIPRMTTSQRTAGWATSEGLMVFDSDIEAFFYYDGSSWIRLIASPSKQQVNLNNFKITNLANGTNAGDAVNKGQLDTKLNLSGGSMSGNIAMGNNQITGMANGTNSGDAINRSQLDTKLSLSGGTMSGAIAMGSNKITNVADGTNANDAVNVTQLEEATGVWSARGGSSSWLGGVRWVSVNTGSSDFKNLNITAWADFDRNGGSAYLTLQIRSSPTSPANSTAGTLLIQRNFRPGVETIVSQEALHFRVSTTDQYFWIRVDPQSGGDVAYYGIEVRRDN